MSKNAWAAGAYILGWLSGLVVLLLSKDSYVRFHAMQSMVVFGGMTLLLMLPIIGALLSPFVALVGFILWLVLIYKAYTGEEWEVPYVGKWVRKLLASM